MALPEAVGTADAVLAYSGPRPLYDAHESTLGSLGIGLHLGDDPGLSATHEMATLVLMWGMLNGFPQRRRDPRHGRRVRHGVPPHRAQTAIDAVADWLPGYAQQVDNGTYPADDGTIDTHLAAMTNVVEESESLGVNTELPSSSRHWPSERRRPATVPAVTWRWWSSSASRERAVAARALTRPPPGGGGTAVTTRTRGTSERLGRAALRAGKHPRPDLLTYTPDGVAPHKFHSEPSWLVVTPFMCHYGAMDLTAYVNSRERLTESLKATIEEATAEERRTVSP